MRGLWKLSLVSLLLSAVLTGCSGTKTATDDNGTLPPPESSADKVGSTPEDKIADDIFGSEPNNQNLDAGKSPNPSDPANSNLSDDPFADITDQPTNSQANNNSLPSVAEPPPPPVAEPRNSYTSEPDPFADAKEPTYSDFGGDTKKYVVKPGDTLMKIAFTLYGDIEAWHDIYDLNRSKVKRLSDLKVGQELSYHSPKSDAIIEQHDHQYLIKQGDTLSKIADEVYGRMFKFKKLQKYNEKLIKDPNRIFAGFQISYDITPKEMAEAEARKQERLAKQGGAAPASAPASETAKKLPADVVAKKPASPGVPSAINPPVSPAKDKKVAKSPAPAPVEKAPGPASQIPQEEP